MHNINWASGRCIILVPHLLQEQPLLGPGFQPYHRHRCMYCVMKPLSGPDSAFAMRRCFSHIWLRAGLHFVSVAVIAFNDPFSLSEATWLLCVSLLQGSRF